MISIYVFLCDNLRFNNIFELMGNCCGITPIKKLPKEALYQIRQILSNEEIIILHLMYKDLADRIVERKINLENFLLFFHKNGFWGDRLFKQFDYDETNLISQEEFIRGIAKILKSSQKEKISLLFKFFSKNGQTNGGVFFNQFLTMLYNYPKEDLKQVLSDKEFIELELKKHLVPIDNLKRAESLDNVRAESFTRISINNSGIQRNEKRKVSMYRLQDEREQMPIPSMIGKNIMKNIKQIYKPKQKVITLKDGQITYDIKTINIQQLVKKFALRIFNQAKIDVNHGKLNFEQFQKWIITHKTLYENYYDGFHNQVWEIDPIGKPKYLSSKCQKQSDAKVIINDHLVKVYLYLLHSILVICDQKNKQKPLLVICLQGLAVKRIFEEDKGFGIEITHRDAIYSEKRIYFKNQALLLQWMDQFKYYKGQTVQQKYDLHEKIGTGKFSVVYRCLHNYENKEYAIKVIETFKLEPEARQIIAHESSIMKIVSHPLLLEFKQCIQTSTHIYIITELVKGKDLFQFVKVYRYLNEYDAAKIAQQIMVGIRFLHSFEIVHRDLKPQNIMIVFDDELQQVSNIKIIDFGFANYLSKLHQKSSEQLLAGTPNYIAPQVLREENFSFKIDNFAIGVIIYFMLTGTLPFNDFTISDILKNTIEGAYTYPEGPTISSEAKNLIGSLLQNKPQDRLSLQDSLKHPWFNILQNSQMKKRQEKIAAKILLL